MAPKTAFDTPSFHQPLGVKLCRFALTPLCKEKCQKQKGDGSEYSFYKSVPQTS